MSTPLRLNRFLTYELKNVLLRFIGQHYEQQYIKAHSDHTELLRYLNDLRQHRTEKLADTLITSEQYHAIKERHQASKKRIRKSIAAVFSKLLTEITRVLQKHHDDSPDCDSMFLQTISHMLETNEEKIDQSSSYEPLLDNDYEHSEEEIDVDLFEDEEDDDEEDEEEEDEESPIGPVLGGGRVINLGRILHVLERAHRGNEKKMSKEAVEFMELLRARESRGSEMQCFDRLEEKERCSVLAELRNLNTDVTQFRPVIFRLLLSNVDREVKSDIMTRLDNARSESEGHKFYNWLDGLLKIPFGLFCPSVCDEIRGNKRRTRQFFEESRKLLDQAVYGHDRAKHAVMQFLGQLVKNPANSASGQILGIEGPPGNGKTTLIQNGLAKALKRPFFSIPLGGASDGSFLNGHSYTYEGSTWGQIVEVLMKAKVMNPVIYMDELDKISTGYKGDEIINLLIHLVDMTQNNFQDKYFGNIDIDLSGVTWVFSYNDADQINPVLRDRITQVTTSGFTRPEKIQIAHQFLIPRICSDVCMAPSTLSISDEVVRFVIDMYTREGGVRRLKELLTDIIRDINLDELCGTIKLYSGNKRRRGAGSEHQRVFNVTVDAVRKKYLSYREEYLPEKIHDVPTIGRICGMYATCNGIGGIIPIEVNWIPSDTLFSLNMTGNLGKVMQESTKVARTLAWSLVTIQRQQELQKQWSSYKQGVHVHCPEGSMKKEGPSAGTALTTALVSLLTQNPIRNDIAITGEMNLSGEVTEIGGLREKMYGAKQAGCTLILFPKDNQKSLNKILRECPDLIVPGEFEAVAVSTIHEVLDIALTHNHHCVPPPVSTEKGDTDVSQKESPQWARSSRERTTRKRKN